MYLWLEKVCETLGLSVHLKVKWKSICFQLMVWSGISECPVLFKAWSSQQVFVEVYHGTNKWDLWWQLRKRAKGCWRSLDSIIHSQSYYVQSSLTRSGPPTMITPKTRRVTVYEFTKEPRVTTLLCWLMLMLMSPPSGDDGHWRTLADLQGESYYSNFWFKCKA